MHPAHVSTFELFKIGIGPSSSHTMGPMCAARRFVDTLIERHLLQRTSRVTVDLYGSLALTGRGHATDRAVIIGLAGFLPHEVSSDQVFAIEKQARDCHVVQIGQQQRLVFEPERDIHWRYGETNATHPTALTVSAFNSSDETLFAETYFSLGGGFIATQAELDTSPDRRNQSEIP
ncbi:MAG TPA: serine dehydratase beta chain, partial [Steroidobacteraceae bacterium]|nr:serine dehydratase beta chain [Steroidobacteraceae bacterium]